MSVEYRKIRENLKKFLEDSFSGVTLSKKFDIDNNVFPKEYTKNEEEKEEEETCVNWLKNIEIYFCENTFSGEKILLAKYLDDCDGKSKGSYIIYISEDDIYLNTSNLQKFVEKDYEDNINLGVFLSLFNKPKYYPLINRKINRFEIEDILNIEYNNEINNHDYNQIKKLFYKTYLFKIKEENIELNNLEVDNKEEFIYKFLGVLKCKNKIENIANETYFNKDCIEAYLNLFQDDIKYLPYENLYLSLCHNSPKFIFLEIYRMIEKLYPIIFTYNMKIEFQLNNKELLELNDIMEKRYNIRHTEAESIAAIFEFGKNNKKINKSIQKLEQYKKSIDNSNLALHDWIYQIRNTSVHLSFNKRRNNDLDIKTILNNSTVITNLVSIVGELYRVLF